MWFKRPEILAVHNCYIKVNPGIEGDSDDFPEFGGPGAGPIVGVEQPPPDNDNKPIPRITTPHNSSVEEQQEEEEEEETESERYWCMNTVKKRNSNELYYPGRHQEDDS
jgi:hypothetical protein